MNRRWTSRWTGPVSAVLIAIVAIAALVTAHGYSRSSGFFPVFIGWIFVGLTFVETGLQFRRVFGRPPRRPGDAEMGLVAVDRVVIARELAGIAWVCAFLLALYLSGFIVATPLFLFAFLRFAGERPRGYSALAAVAATAVVYGVFAWLLEYRLFPGVLFGG